jgi:Arc/MetJ-type ribon-helix-helix transcriptional regulator
METHLRDKLDELVDKGRFEDRSSAISYCVNQVLQLENLKVRAIEFLIDLLVAIQESPEIGDFLINFLEMKRNEMRER